MRKRRDVFKFLREKKASIYCLQDTHLIESDNNIIYTQWGFDHILTPGSTESRGVLNLFNNNFDFTLGRVKKDDVGNLLISDIEINDKITITLVNIYGPNRDSPEFYNQLYNICEEMESEFIIFCGDWNLVQDYNQDCYNYKANNNQNSKSIVDKIKNDFNLVDPWRIYNPSLKAYTWHRKNPVKQARLDFFLISQELMSLVKGVKILPGYRTDHSYIELEIQITNFKKGRGFWRFNNNLLKDLTYANKVKDCILQTKEEYVPSPVLRNMINNIPNENLQLNIDDDLFLEMLLMKIRGITISYSSWKNKERCKLKLQIETEIKSLQDAYDKTHDIITCEKLTELNTCLEDIRNYELEGLITRSRAQWIEQGEKPTKYFCNLEKRNFTNKTIVRLLDNNGEEIINQCDILSKIKNFYEDLYSSRDHLLDDIDLNNKLNNYEIPKLTEIEKDMLERNITKSEVLESLKRCKNNKTPGCDGFTAEFFKFFWTDLGDFIYRSFLISFEKKELSQSQTIGVITVLPKGNKPREEIKNWRPISLLNVTYKILSGIIANRLKNILPNIIHENQKGFLPGRYIGENTRLLYDIIQICNEKNIPGLLLMIDFEKAFDSISWKFVRNVLNFYNFGPNIRQWINIFFTNFRLCVIQNGFTSPFFKIERGCRQGDPVSSYIFLLCVEIMGILFRINREIRGINILDREYKLLQYADDTVVLLDGTKNSLKNTLSLIEQFSKFSGLKPNYTKTLCIKIGSLQNQNLNYENKYGLKWSQEPFTFLGITFTAELKNMLNLNYENKIKDIEKLIKSWSRRLLSTAGKITVVKSILLPKLTHLFISLPNPSKTQMKYLEYIFYRFIWKNKKDKISRRTLIQDFSNGGMRMICLKSFIYSLKVSWLRRIMMSNKTSWINLLIDTLPNNFINYMQLGSEYFKFIASKINNNFWKDVFMSFYKFRNIIDKEDDILFHSIWFNELIKVGNKTIYYRKWLEQGIMYVYDFLDENRQILKYRDFCDKFKIYPAFTLYYGVVRCLQHILDITNMNIVHYIFLPYRPKFIEIITKNTRGVRHIYDIFVYDDYIRPKSEAKWEIDFHEHHDIEWWFKQNTLIKSVTDDIYLRWFQYRIVHRIIGTNSFLYKIKLKASNLCTFCSQDSETILHIFWACSVTSQIWINFVHWIKYKLNIDTELNETDVILGKCKVTESNRGLNLVICVIKSYIYKEKIKAHIPTFTGSKSFLKHYMRMDKYTYTKNMNMDAFINKWGKFTFLLQE